ncbi:hypothetical protein AB0L49_49870 [Streptomyces antimycoticus]|uniref:hypothetical protein n=1 Tax=Streptomyces TaxID=1883 RepID=UPI003434BD5D
MITGDEVDAAALARELHALGRTVPVHRSADLAEEAAGTLGMKPGEVWVIRPDAHLAATLADPTARAVNAALTRGLGAPVSVLP